MKQLLIATLSLAGLFAPGFAFAQYDCFLVCNPARVYCQPSGVPMPPIYKLCGVSAASAPDSLAASLDASSPEQAAPAACSAQQVFDEDTQTYEWQMVCD